MVKFRVWDNILNQMFQWDDLIKNPQLLFDAFAGKDAVALQYTGEHDRHRVEIYEGDIIKNGDLVAVVKFTDVGSCGCCWPEFNGVGLVAFTEDNRKSVDMSDKCEVIGNIYENPDLNKEF